VYCMRITATDVFVLRRRVRRLEGVAVERLSKSSWSFNLVVSWTVADSGYDRTTDRGVITAPSDISRVRCI
jgi:hypothetical protein